MGIIVKTLEKRDAKIVAEEVYKTIKKSIKDNNDSIAEVEIDYRENGYGERPWGSGREERFRNGTAKVTHTMNFCGKVLEFENVYEMERVSDRLKEMFKNDGYAIEMTEVTAGDWPHEYRYNLISVVTAINKLAPSFTKIQKYLLKYANYKLDPMKCYYAPTSGKRGRYYESRDDRRYYCLDEGRCANFLAALKKSKTSRDLVSVKDYDDENQEDKRYSEYYETECYGSVKHTINVSVNTPSGKLKANLFL